MFIISPIYLTTVSMTSAIPIDNICFIIKIFPVSIIELFTFSLASKSVSHIL